MKLGFIDIGSNSIRLLLATVKNNTIVDSFKELRTTRLSNGVDRLGYLSEDSMQRSIQALIEFKDLMCEYGIDNEPMAIATSAIRDSKNKQDFISRIEELGIRVKIISGQEEASLGFLGVLKGTDIGDENILVIDIGGGSTELILGNNRDGILQKISINMGAVRMTERYIDSDTPSKENIRALRENIRLKVENFKDSIANIKVTKAIGIGGTVTNIASIDQKMTVYDSDKIHNYTVSNKKIKEILDKLVVLKNNERKRMDGLQESRSDVIIAGITICEIILESFGQDSIMISESDNLEGLAYTTISKG